MILRQNYNIVRIKCDERKKFLIKEFSGIGNFGAEQGRSGPAREIFICKW
jgi:hypothetical protein